MGWLRLDDGFADHRKLVALKTDQRRWTWLRLLIYTARYRTPIIPGDIGDVVAGATPKFLGDCRKIGLLDDGEDGDYLVHDWYDYQPSGRQNDLDADVAKLLDEQPSLSANHVARIIGGTRKDVLDAVKRYQTGSESVRNAGTRTGTARAWPVPYPNPAPPLAEVRTESSSSKADAGLTRARFEPPAPASRSNGPDATDPLTRMVLELRDRDAGTEHVFRVAFGGLPEAAFHYTRTEILRCRGEIDSDSGAARRILERIAETGNIGDPDYAPPAADAKPASPLTAFEKAKALIRNLAKADGFETRDAERELDEHHITDPAERAAILDDIGLANSPDDEEPDLDEPAHAAA